MAELRQLRRVQPQHDASDDPFQLASVCLSLLLDFIMGFVPSLCRV